ELAADVGRIAGGALARGHALAARAGEARGAGLDEAAAGAVLVALPDLVLLLAGAVGRARHADAAAAVVVATAARSAAAVPAARKGARDERAQQPRASHPSLHGSAQWRRTCGQSTRNAKECAPLT